MEIDQNKRCALEYILERMIEWESENLRFVKNPKHNSLEAFVAYELGEDVKNKYQINSIDFSLLVKKLDNDKHIIIGDSNTIKVNITAKEFLKKGGYNQNKYIVWLSNLDNLWKILAFAIGAVISVFLASRKK